MADWYKTTERKLDTIEIAVSEIASKLKNGIEQDPESILYDNDEFIKFMKISKRTAQYWRNENIIGYFQVGSKIYYSLADIQILLKSNYKNKIDKP